MARIITIILCLSGIVYGTWGDWGDFERPIGDIWLSADGTYVVWTNDNGTTYTIAVRASDVMEETYKGKWPVKSGEPNSVLMTPGDVNSQWRWAIIDPNLIVADPNDPNYPEISLPTLTPGSVLFVDANGLPLYEDNDNLFFDDINDYLAIGMSGTRANNYIQVQDLLEFDNDLFNTELGWQAGNSLTLLRNTVGGYNSGYAVDGNDNTFYGYNAGKGNAITGMAMWLFESGALTTDSLGNNDLSLGLTPTANTTDFKEGVSSVDLDPREFLTIANNDLDPGYPLGSSDTTKNFTVCFWSRLDAIPGAGFHSYCYSKEGGGTVTIAVSYYNTGAPNYVKMTLTLSYNGTSKQYFYHGTGGMTTGIWYFVGVTYELDGGNGNYRIRVWDDNASSILGSDRTGTSGTIYVGGAPVYIGADPAVQQYNGQIDKMIVFNEALTADEIDRVRTGTLAVPGSVNAEIHRVAAFGNRAAEIIKTGADDSLYLGNFSGSYNETDPNVFYLDNLDRGTYALGKTNSMMYGYFSATLGDQWLNINADVNSISLNLSDLTASRLVATDGSKTLVSSDLFAWVAATANETTVADDGDGTITVGIIDPLIVGKGGTGASSFTDTHVIYMNGTVLAGDATFNFNDTTKVLDVDGLTVTGTIATGLDMSGGTFATAIQHWPEDGTLIAGTETILKYKNNISTSKNYGYGAHSFDAITSGYHNTSFGAWTLYQCTEGRDNNAMGTFCLYSLTTGFENNMMGLYAGEGIIGGSKNSGMGTFSLNKGTSIISCTGVGYGSGRYNVVGYLNTSVGAYSGEGTVGNSYYRSTHIGAYSGAQVTTADDVVYIGAYAGYNQTNLDDRLIIDNKDQGSAAAEITDSLIYGIFSAGANDPASQSLRINGEILGSVGAKIGDAGVTNYAQFATDGELTLAGTARVMGDVDFEPDAVKKGGVGPADSTEDGFPMHDYDSTNDESVHVHWEVPHDYASAGTIHIHFEWFVDTAPGAAANVTFGCEYKKQSIGDNFDFGAGTTTAIVNTAITTGTPANDKKTHETGEIDLTTTGFVPGDFILMRFFRDADASEGGATDDFGSDVRVFNYHLEFLKDKLGEAT